MVFGRAVLNVNARLPNISNIKPSIMHDFCMLKSPSTLNSRLKSSSRVKWIKFHSRLKSSSRVKWIKFLGDRNVNIMHEINNCNLVRKFGRKNFGLKIRVKERAVIKWGVLNKIYSYTLHILGFNILRFSIHCTQYTLYNVHNWQYTWNVMYVTIVK